MNAQAIELDGFEIELSSELYCERGGDHRELVERAVIAADSATTSMNLPFCACGA